MNRKAVGLALIVVGVALAMWGYDIYDSASSQISRTLGGETPMKAWLGMVGGAICIGLGVLRMR